MGRLGILTCQVLEKELAFLLNNREDIDVILLRKTLENRKFSLLLEKETKLINDPAFLRTTTNRREILVEVVPAGLHVDINELEGKCHDIVNLIKGVTTGILFFYGLCGNALKNEFRREDITSYFIDDDGIIDDCIVASLGRERYMEELRKGGIFFLTSGWIDYWDTINANLERTSSQQNILRQLVALNKYEKVLYIRQNTAFSILNEYSAKKISSDLNLDYSVTDGMMSLFDEALTHAIKSTFTLK